MPFRLVVSPIFLGTTNFTIFRSFCNFRSFRNFRSIRLCPLDLLFHPFLGGQRILLFFAVFVIFAVFAVFVIFAVFRQCPSGMLFDLFMWGLRNSLFFAVFVIFAVFGNILYALQACILTHFSGGQRILLFFAVFAVFAAACNSGHYSPASSRIHCLTIWGCSIHRCSDDCPIGKKMIYASSKDALKKRFTGLNTEFQCTDTAEFQYSELVKDLIHKDRL